MPTQHVEPALADLLQDVATSVLKARKVVVVTGAGISTNSGIPDFRSENGLYSLIQAQFDAAARQDRERVPHEDDAGGDADQDMAEVDSPPKKRRKISRENSIEPLAENQAIKDEIEVCVDLPRGSADDPVEDVLPEPRRVPIETPVPLPFILTTPKPRASAVLDISLGSSSPLSSPPPEAFMNPPSVFRRPFHGRLTDIAIPLSSSPLSSPPPILFDPFMPSSPSDASSERSVTSRSEVDEPSITVNPFSASQASAGGGVGSRSSLPNMKGKDLFDASIWADPLRTSVFYTFATSLRQKIKDVEPTASHLFIRHLRDRGKLVRCYTQNIDQIEEKVGLSTSLKDGPGTRGRFSRRNTATSQLSKMVEEVSSNGVESGSNNESSSQSGNDSSQPTLSSTQESITGCQRNGTTATQSKALAKPTRPEQRSGVECVFLHGSLELLRCFLCGRVCSWDDDNRAAETLSGQQPECPHCLGATVAREERGKRALGVGKLRPDIVLYGEEHPNSHLISPIVTHDLALNPDMLLILGTSLRVHGLKVMVREFAKAVHSKGGKVVFVNFTKPSESSWGDIIDYWVQWDCDAWVDDLQSRVPKLWQDPEPRRPKKKTEGSNSEHGSNQKKEKPPPANPVALRDTKVTGAYWTPRIVGDLHRITGTPPLARRASLPPAQLAAEVKPGVAQAAVKSKRPRKSAPGALEKPKKTSSSTLNPNHGRSRRKTTVVAAEEGDKENSPALQSPRDSRHELSSILNSVKANPRVRKRKKIDGEEVCMPSVGGGGRSRTPVSRAASQNQASKADLKLAPLLTAQQQTSPFGKPQPLEPRSPPSGPLASISVNLRTAGAFGRKNAFYLEDPLLKLIDGNSTPHWAADCRPTYSPSRKPARSDEKNVALTLAGLKTGLEGKLGDWGSRWHRTQ